MGKKPRKPKKSKGLGLTKSKLDDLAWQFAKVMKDMPPREHVHETFIDWEGHRGCIPAGLQYAYQYCQNCFYIRGCMKDEINWRLSKDGKLTSYR